MQACRSPKADGMCVTMIYLICPKCGYSIDILKDEEVNNPVRAKRMKYLTTRDQVCPNCVNTIGKCEKIESPEEGIPLLRVQINGEKKEKFIEYCRKNGYAVCTDYTLERYKEAK